MKQVYLFTGDDFLRERALQRKIAEIKAHGQLDEVHLDAEGLDNEKLLEELFTPSLFAPGKLILIRRVEKLPEGAGLVQLLERGLPAGFFLLLSAEKLDQRSKLVHLIAERGEAEDFPKPDRRSLPKLVRDLLREQGVELTAEAFRCLLEMSEPELHHLANEIEKLSLYPHEGPLGVEDLKGLIFGGRGAGIFAFLEELGSRRPQALVSLRQLLAEGEDPNRVFFMIAGEIRALLAVKSLAEAGRSLQEITAETGQYPWLVKRRLSQVKSFREEELIDLIYLLHRKDARLKRGEAEPEEALYRIVLAITGMAQPREGSAELGDSE
ncbi:MAG: DNA polymerase III subunit delta [Candidatus Acetothermia bacterium]|nr:DNA polymerase III subunit delta [Candidatus Acetothermia bacterium]MDH7504650.1 DNA polymerase III subunit delta [Candidatus Acetothermia bacterium]